VGAVGAFVPPFRFAGEGWGASLFSGSVALCSLALALFLLGGNLQCSFTPKCNAPRRTTRRGSFRPATWRFVGLMAAGESLCPDLPVSSVLPPPFFAPFQSLVINAYAFFCGYGFFYVWLTYRSAVRRATILLIQPC